MTRRPSFLAALSAVLIVGSSFLVTVAPAGAAARPAASPLTGLLRRAALATAAMKSAHTQGAGQLTESEKTHGYSLSITVGATFRGDFSDRGGKARAHLRGQLRAGGQARMIRLVAAGRTLADKVGKTKWSCTAIPVSTPKPTSLNPAEIKAVRKFLIGLEKKIRVADLGSTIARGVPVWDIQASLVTRLNLQPLVGIASKTKSISSALAVKYPKPWVHLKVNLWISQANYTVQRFAIAARVHIKTVIIAVHLNDWLSRYGEHVPIKLPPACAATSAYPTHNIR